MRFHHPERPGLGVRLGYGLNVFPSRDARGVLEGLRTLALPLRARQAPSCPSFGVGAWLPARAARELASDPRLLRELVDVCAAGGLDAFSFNAFPHGAFHGPGLKERVFEPDWRDPARLAFTLDVARLAVQLRHARGGEPGAHLSISTHCGMFAPAQGPGDRAAVAEGFLAAARALAELEAESGERVVLALEPEPRSSANDTHELVQLLEQVHARASAGERDALARHLGSCLDTCHAAVEFEAPAEALARATARGTTLGKLQFSSALALERPDADAPGRDTLLALDEPVYLHQLTGRRGRELVRARDLDEPRRHPEAFAGCDEWRCHFHVPVDLARLGGAGALRTTRAEAEATLAAALAAPERWGSSELHVEVETYTWNLLDPARTGAATVLDGLARELTHVSGRLAAAGWVALR